MALNNVIKKARLKNNLKQEYAAKLVGVTVQTYSKWENGKTEPKATQVANLSKILKVPTNEICNGEESKKIELIDFMIKISEISKEVSDFELNMAIWESLEDDETFFNNIRKYRSSPDRYLLDENDQEMSIYKAKKDINPNYYDKSLEALISLNEQEEEIEFIKGLNDQDIEHYEKIIKKYHEKDNLR